MTVLKNMFAVALFFWCCCIISCTQQTDKEPGNKTNMRILFSVKDSMLLSVDKSPMDMIYFPENYPTQKMLTPGMADPAVRIIYSRPHKNGRIIFADTSVHENVIQRYGHDWRLGANEATEVEFFNPVSINGNKIAAGRYIMYCVPYPGKWKIVFNSNLFSWGLHIDKAKDISSVELPVVKNEVMIEYFTMLFQNAAYGCDLVMAWGDAKVLMPISFK